MNSEYTNVGGGRSQTSSAGERAEKQMRHEAQGIKEDTLQQGRMLVEQGKGTAAAWIGDIADALQSAAGELEGKNRPTSADYVRVISRSVRRFSNSLEERSTDELFSQARIIGRRQPVLLLGGAALVGFALTRLLKTASREVVEEEKMSSTRHSAEHATHAAEGRTTSPPGTRSSQTEGIQGEEDAAHPQGQPTEHFQGRTSEYSQVRPTEHSQGRTSDYSQVRPSELSQGRTSDYSQDRTAASTAPECDTAGKSTPLTSPMSRSERGSQSPTDARATNPPDTLS